MECSNTLIESVVTIGQLAFAYSCFYYLGPLVGLITIVAVFLAFKLYTEYYLKMRPLTVEDKILLSDNFLKKQQVLVEHECDKDFNLDKIVEAIKFRAFAQIPKLSFVLTYKFFNFYWIKSNKNKEEIFKERIIIHKPMNETELKQFKSDQLQIELDFFKTPIEFHILQAKESLKKDGTYDKGYVFVKIDHAFTDGMGIVTLMTCMGDNFYPKIFPRIMNERNVSIFDKVKEFVLFLIVGLPLIIWVLIYTKSVYRMSNLPRTRKVGFTRTIIFDLPEIKKRSKELKMTINEMCTASLLASISKIKKDKKKVNLEVPIGLTPIPNSLSEVTMNNCVFALFSHMTLIEDPLKDINVFKEEYKSLFRQALISRITDWGAFLLASMLPFNVAKELSLGVVNEVDLVISNVPGPIEPVIINGNRFVSVIAYTTTGYLPNDFILVSYNNKLRMVGIYDAGQDFDADTVADNYEKIFGELLNGKRTTDINKVNTISSEFNEEKGSSMQKLKAE